MLKYFRRLIEDYNNPWTNEEDEVPEALRDNIGIELIEYVLEIETMYLITANFRRTKD